MNKLNCECNHLRKDHESGKEKLSDSSVSKCMIKDCPCNEYHANYETRKLIWKLRFKAFFWSGIIITGVALAGFIGYEMINFSVDNALYDYSIAPKLHVMNKWSNGTLTNSSSWYQLQDNPKEMLTTAAFDPLLFILFFIGLIGSMTCYSTMMESNYKRLIHE